MPKLYLVAVVYPKDEAIGRYEANQEMVACCEDEPTLITVPLLIFDVNEKFAIADAVLYFRELLAARPLRVVPEEVADLDLPRFFDPGEPVRGQVLEFRFPVLLDSRESSFASAMEIFRPMLYPDDGQRR